MGVGMKIAAAVVGLGAALAAPAGLASADQRSAQDVINQLRNEGYSVNIDRVGSAPLSECVVTNVRNSQGVNQWSPMYRLGLPEEFNQFTFPVIARSVSVTVNCS
jgi:hypothetical protein